MGILIGLIVGLILLHAIKTALKAYKEDHNHNCANCSHRMFGTKLHTAYCIKHKCKIGSFDNGCSEFEERLEFNK